MYAGRRGERAESFLGAYKPGRLGPWPHQSDGKAGRGFDAGKIKNGNGLTNMRRRAESMKGSIQIDSEVGKGTRIAVDLHLT